MGIKVVILHHKIKETS